jgi:hypothetical protein
MPRLLKTLIPRIKRSVPSELSVLYFFDPCGKKVLVETLQNIRKSLCEHPRQLYVVYVSPVHDQLFDSADFLRKLVRNEEHWFSIYAGL